MNARKRDVFLTSIRNFYYSGLFIILLIVGLITLLAWLALETSLPYLMVGGVE